jgi:hypothetical protein
MSIQNVMIHYKDSMDNLHHLLDLDLFFTTTDTGLEVIVEDNDIEDDEEFVTHYGLDYEQVNCIELV